MSPISKPVVYSRTLCSVKCIPESECVCTVEPQRSGSVCSDLSGSVYTTMLGATSPNTLTEPPTVTNTVHNQFQQLLTQSAVVVNSSKKTDTFSNKTDPTTTTQQNSLTTINNPSKENNEKPAHNNRRDSTCSTTSTSTHTHSSAPSDWYSKSRTFTSVYFRQFVHSSNTSRNLCAEITPEMMQLKPQLCMSVQESEELKQRSVYDPTVLLGYQVCIVGRFSVIDLFYFIIMQYFVDHLSLFRSSGPSAHCRSVIDLYYHRSSPELAISHRVQTLPVCVRREREVGKVATQ